MFLNIHQVSILRWVSYLPDAFRPIYRVSARHTVLAEAILVSYLGNLLGILSEHRLLQRSPYNDCRTNRPC